MWVYYNMHVSLAQSTRQGRRHPLSSPPGSALHLPARQLLRRGPSDKYRPMDEEGKHEDSESDATSPDRPFMRLHDSTRHMRRVGSGPNWMQSRAREPQQPQSHQMQDAAKLQDMSDDE